jgi:hypothetical protein
MTFKQKMESVTRRLFMKEFSSGPNCPPNTTLHSRQLSFGPEIQYIHIRKIAIGGAVADFITQIAPLPLGPSNSWDLMFLSCDPIHINDTLTFHFKPLYKGAPNYAGGNAVTMTGAEEWYIFNNSNIAASPAGIKQPGNYFRFYGPMPPQLYWDIGQEAGGTDYSITLAIGPGLGGFFGR